MSSRDRPLDVLGRAVVCFHRQSQTGKPQNLVVGEDAPRPFARVERDLLVVPVGSLHDLDGLDADPYVEQSRPRALDHIGVRLDLAAHDDLSLTEGRFDDDVIGMCPRRVDGEHHTRALGGDHLLDDHGQRRFVADPLGGPVRDHPLPVQRRPAVHHPGEELLVLGHVGEGGVHAGKRNSRAVLARPRGAHGHPCAGPQAVIGSADGVGQMVGYRRGTARAPGRAGRRRSGWRGRRGRRCRSRHGAFGAPRCDRWRQGRRRS